MLLNRADRRLVNETLAGMSELPRDADDDETWTFEEDLELLLACWWFLFVSSSIARSSSSSGMSTNLAFVLPSLMSVFRFDELEALDSPQLLPLLRPFFDRNKLAKFSLISFMLCVCSLFRWNFFSLLLIVLWKVAVVRLEDLKFL